MTKEKVSFKSGNHKLIGVKYLPKITPAPGIILLHGLTNTKDDCPLINQSAEKLVKSGFFVFKFDFFGSGESPGEMKDKTINTLKQNTEDALKYFLQDKRATNMGLWGRSLGGTMVCLLDPHKRIKARVSLSAGVVIEKGFKKVFVKLKKKQEELEKKGKGLPGTGKYKGKYDFGSGWFRSLKGLDKKIASNLKKINNVLVLATTPDKKAGLENAYQIMNLVQEPKRLRIFKNTDHAYTSVENEAVKEVVNWFVKYL